MKKRFQTHSPSTFSPCAYLRKFRLRDSSIMSCVAPECPSRCNVLLRSYVARSTPRNAHDDRCRRMSSCHESENSAVLRSSQLFGGSFCALFAVWLPEVFLPKVFFRVVFFLAIRFGAPVSHLPGESKGLPHELLQHASVSKTVHQIQQVAATITRVRLALSDVGGAVGVDCDLAFLRVITITSKRTVDYFWAVSLSCGPER